MAVIALDLGGTKLAGAVFSEVGEPLVRSLVSLDNRSAEAVGRLIAEQLQLLGDAAARKRLTLKAAAISVPGISFPDGRVWAPNIPGWENYPLARELRKMPAVSTCLKGRPVLIENDRACYMLGEHWRGHARGCRDAIFLAVGTGIGAGILANGQILNGYTGTAGSIGWMALNRPFREDYRSEGCFEHHASGGGLGRAAQRFRGRTHRSSTAIEVFDSFERGEPMGKTLVAEAVQFWGMAVANLVSLFNPEKIIFGGGIFGPAARLIPEIRAEAARWAQPIAMKTTRLCVSRLGADAGLYGAGFVAVRALKR